MVGLWDHLPLLVFYIGVAGKIVGKKFSLLFKKKKFEESDDKIKVANPWEGETADY